MEKVWRPELELTEQEYRRLIQDQFPELGPIEIKCVGTGWDSIAFEVDGDKIFRFPRRKAGNECLSQEIQFTSTLQKHLSLPIPTPKWVGSLEHKDWIFVGHETVPGKTACQLRLSDGERRKFIKPAAKFLKELHSIDVEAARSWGVGEDRYKKTNAVPWVEPLLVRIKELEPDPDFTFSSKIKEWIKTFAKRSQESMPRVPVHGDFYFRHLIIDQQKLVGVIDWGDCHIGIPAYDLSVLFTFFTEESHSDFFEIYGKVDEETYELSRFFGLYYLVTLAWYARDVQDEDLIWEIKGVHRRFFMD